MTEQILDHGYVRFIEAWGSEERIIEAARMSTGKGFQGWNSDAKLLAYLYNNHHATPFEMAGMVIEVKAPIFVFREWHRHRTQSYNEMSARYIPLPDENYVPTFERVEEGSRVAAGNRQAQGLAPLDYGGVAIFLKDLDALYRAAQGVYERALAAGVPKELARLPVPVARYSRMRASANLRNWLAFLTLRMAPTAQWEIRQLRQRRRFADRSELSAHLGAVRWRSMGEITEISWAHSTFNPWQGCTKVSPGCDHCYAEALSKRWGHDRWGPGKERQRTSAANWKQPLKWDRLAAQSGQPWRVFCASMADVFDNDVPAAWRMELFDLIRRTPALTWMLLTKRIGNVEQMLPGGWYARSEAPNGPYPNVWLGITVVNQEEVRRDVAKLLDVPARVRFLSIEPQLEAIDLRGPLATGAIHWVINGGESGHKARPFDLGWTRSLRDQCAAAQVSFFMKQDSGSRSGMRGRIPDDLWIHEFPHA